MFAVTRIPPSLIEDRLDARYNAPLAVETRKKILTSGIKSNSVGGLYNLVCGPFGSTLTSDEHDASGEVLLIQPTNISGDAFSDASSWRITKKALIEKDLKTYPEGTLLFARVGIYPHVGIIPKEAGLCTISSSMIAGLPKSNIDTHFLVAFFKCIYGNTLLNAAQKVTAQPTIGTTEIANTLVPIPEEIAQKYIGDKVRQAEQLRAWAKRLEDSVHCFHSQFIPSQDHLDFNKKTRKVSVFRMTERLDAHFYPGVVEQYLNAHPGKFESVRTLTSIIYNGQTQPETLENFCEQITVAHLSASFVKGQPRKVKAPSKNDKFVKPHDILMCNAAHNKSYIGRELTYVHTDKKLLPSTEVMTIRVNRDLVPASYVRTYLLSCLGYVKIQSTIRGITAHSYPDDVALLDIYIPEVEPILKQEWFRQDDLLVQAGFAVELAQLLTSSAKILVEALIEGQLTEQQLIQAQQALDDGDNSLDQAILSKLSNEGYAIAGATPLFNDIDELYRLLESAAQAEAEA